MSKPNKIQVLIKQEREKRQAELAQIDAAINQRQNELQQLMQTKLKTIGCIEQLNELEK